MTIGLDLSSLQGAHRMRGIGYTLINFINNLPPELRNKHRFIFFYYRGSGSKDPLELLRLEGIQYETRSLQPAKRSQKTLPRKLNLLIKLYNQILSVKEVYLGDSRIEDMREIDVFLQTDQTISVPRGKGLKKIFIAYDVIPYVLEWDYLWNYKTARFHRLPRQAALRCAGRRWLYIHKLRVNARRADKVLSISDTTKRDFIKYVPAARKKILTVPLGVNFPEKTNNSRPKMHRYMPSSWGYLRKPFDFDEKTPYILFVGGADKRRRLDDLVTAFNHLRAQGHDIKLVLAGDSMQGPMNISTETVQRALKQSSYLDDIIFMGFVDDRQRDWLYAQARVFVFPSKYEGFGLPVLEAMAHKSPVVSYRNAATLEVAGSVVAYAENAKELRLGIQELLDMDRERLEAIGAAGLKRAKKYDWSKTSRDIVAELTRSLA